MQAKFGLKPLLAHSWKTGGLRPPNFPTVRIAQFAALIHQSSALFSKILAAQTPDDYRQLFKPTPRTIGLPIMFLTKPLNLPPKHWVLTASTA